MKNKNILSIDYLEARHSGDDPDLSGEDSRISFRIRRFWMRLRLTRMTFSGGFSVIEVVLAAAIFMLFSTASVVVVLHGFNANRLGNEETIANQFATEGLEAVKSIKNQSFSSLVTTGGSGVKKDLVTGVWNFSGSNNTFFHNSTDNYIRIITIDDVRRDSAPPDGNIVADGGTIDLYTKKITSTVSWKASPTRDNSVVLITYLSDWRRPLPANRGGILVYGDGGTTFDAIQYKTLDPNNGTWSAESLAGDVDPSTNRALRATRAFASSTRNEKILLSRHYDGTNQYIYGQVFNGATWGNVKLLSSWNASTFLDVRNFDGTYLNNGNFMAVYSDNSSIPKYIVWDGTIWLTSSSLTSLANNGSNTPTYISAKARPGTNEVMAAFFSQNKDTNTEYYNGSTWNLHPRHANNAPVNTKEMIDFAWSPQNNLKGALIFPSGGGDKTINVKIWTADESGSGTWSNTVDSPSSSGKLGAMTIDGRKGAEEFIACQKDDNNDIYCFRSDASPTWVAPANNILTTTSDAGIQRSVDIVYEATSGTEGLAVYSNNSSTPKFREYDATGNSFDTETSLTSALGELLKTVRLMPLQDNDDIIVLMADANNDMYSVVWDGANNAAYTSPSGKAFTTHGVNGSATTEFWYDFAWDKF